MLLVIVIGGEICHSMNKTKDETVRGPVDDDVNSHVVIVKSNLVSIDPWRLSGTVSKVIADAGKATIPYARNPVSVWGE